MPETPYDSVGRASSSPSNSPFEWVEGDLVFSSYRVFRKFQGGSSLVYGLENRDVVERALDGSRIISTSGILSKGSDVLVAAKVLKKELAQDPIIRTAFVDECEKWARIGTHPNIIDALNVRYIGDIPVLIMEFAPLGSLKDVANSKLARSPEEMGTILTWTLDFCQGMKFMVSRGLICHGDIKPANLLLDMYNRLKISDLGLAFLVGIGSSAQGTGTPAYRAPELIRGGQSSFRSDIYSFGVVLYELIIGRKPVNAGADLRSPSALAGRFVRPLGPIVLKCLETDPEKRYGCIEELEDDLQRVYASICGSPYVVPVLRQRLENVEHEAMMWFDIGKPDEAMVVWESSDFRMGEDRNSRIMARYYFEKGQYELALEQFEEFLRRVPTAEAEYGVAICLGRMGRFDEAREACERVLSKDRDFAPAWKLLSGLLIDIAEQRSENQCDCLLEEAIESAEQALTLSAESASTWIHKGHAHLLLGEVEQARKAAEQALNLDSSFPAAWHLLGVSSRRLGDFDQAIECYGKAAALAPRRSWLRHEPLLEKANLLLALGKFSEVQSICSVLHEEGGESLALDYVEGILMVGLDRPARALSLLRHAEPLYQEHVLLLTNIGNALLALGQLEDASEYFKRALRIDQDCVPALNGILALTLTRW